MDSWNKLLSFAGTLIVLWTPVAAQAQVCIPPGQVQASFTSKSFDNVNGLGPNDVEYADFDHDGLLDLAVLNVVDKTVDVMRGTLGGTQFAFSAGFAFDTPRDLVVADFDHDGYDDIAVADEGVNDVVIIVNSNVGFLGVAPVGAGLPGPTALTEGDFDDDGNIDLAVATNAGQIFSLLGTGTGGFGVFSNVGVDVFFDMVAADIDRDGALDLVGTDATIDRVFVATGRGNGSFDPPVFTGVGGVGPESVIVADFNKDGFPDAVTIDTTSQTVSFLKGDGTASFSAVFTFLAGAAFSHRVNEGDFDRDGDLDLLVNDDATNLFFVLENDGSGDFLGPVPFAVDSENFDAAIADFDKDGRIDVAVTLRNANAIELQLNDLGEPCNKPSFAWTSRFLNTGLTPVAITTADINDDARPDYVTANAGSADFAWANGLGNGDFGFPILGALANSVVSVAAADMNGDLAVDVVAAVQNPPVSHELVIFFNDGLGNLGAPTPFPITDAPVHLVLADVNLDNKTDILVTLQSNDVVVGINDGTGTGFAGAAYGVGTSPGAISVGDIDNDGLPDMAVADSNMGTIELFRNFGGGLFTPMGSFIPTALPTDFELVHFDGDGNLDIVAATGIGVGATIESFTGDGSFNFTNADAVLTMGDSPGPHALAVADFDGNGTKDVAVANGLLPRVDIAFGNGAGGFSGSRFEMTADFSQALAVDDLDRDGTPDLLVALAGRNKVQSLLNDGTGVFSPPFHPAPGGDARGSASGDFDRDGMLDLVVANFATDSVTFYRGTGGGGFAPGVDFSVLPGKGPTWLSVDDFDNDGDLDVVASATSTGELVFLPWDAVAGAFDVGLIQLSPLVAAEPPGMHRAADFNQDGDPDIAVASPSANRVQVLRGDGTGKFVFDGALFPGGRPTALQVGDFNRDGTTDIAVVQDTDHILVIFHLTQIFPVPPPGSLGFTQVANPAVAIGPGDFDVTDTDHDGFVEFAVPSLTNQVTIISGFPGYSPAGLFFVGVAPRALRAVDVDRDGHEDLVVTDTATHSIWVLRANGVGGFPDVFELGPGIRSPRFLETADFDRDGRDDLAVVPESFAVPAPAGVAVIFNTNCRSRLFLVIDEPSTCDLPPNPFVTQPKLRFVDDGANPVLCELRDATASLLGPGTLLGNADAMPTFHSGEVQWANLAIAVPGGRGLRLEYNHAEARRKLSDTFTQAPLVDFTGPLNLCLADPALYTATPGFEMYQWTVDAPATPEIQMGNTLDLSGMLGVGVHTLDLVAEQDACFATDSEPSIVVNADLSPVNVVPGGPFSICPLCTGPQLMASFTGGGAVTYQWGYRTVSGGAITPIGGETGPTYTIQGPDFPAEASYFVVVTVTPTCGSPVISNEIAVDITSAAGTPPVTAFTALSTNQQNFLEWAPPTGGCAHVRIIRRPGGPFPTDPNNISLPWEHVGDFPCAAIKDSWIDAGLFNNTKYFYSAFVNISGNYSEKRSVTGLPYDNTVGNVLWAFSTGYTSMTQAGIRYLGSGSSSVYIPTNDHRVYAIEGGPGGGQWLSAAVPFVMGGPSQAWPPTVNLPIAGTANGATYVSSQDGMLYVLDADDLSFIRAEAVAEPLLQAGPAGSFFSSPAAIMLGARNTMSTNVFRSFNPDTGGLQWTFDNSVPLGGDGSNIGLVLSAASIDVANKIVFYGSHLGTGTSTLWALDFSSGTGMLADAVNVGDIEASPIYLGGTTPAVVIGTKSGNVELRDAANLGTLIWSAPYNAGDGGIKGFVLPHSHAGNRNFMFSTASKLTSIRDNGPGTMPSVNWQVDSGSVPSVPNPSIPLFVFGTTRAYVGAANGTVVQIDGIDTPSPTLAPPVVLGDGLSAVGPPSFDIANLTIYVGTTEGVIYAIAYVP